MTNTTRRSRRRQDTGEAEVASMRALVDQVRAWASAEADPRRGPVPSRVALRQLGPGPSAGPPTDHVDPTRGRRLRGRGRHATAHQLPMPLPPVAVTPPEHPATIMDITPLVAGAGEWATSAAIQAHADEVQRHVAAERKAWKASFAGLVERAERARVAVARA